MSDLIARLSKKQPVFLDSSCFIYAFEASSTYNHVATSIFDALSDSAFLAESSVITVSEILTKPFELGDSQLIDQYKEVLDQLPNFAVREITFDTAISAAQIRALYSFKLIDCFQLAVACEHACGAFVTNDKQLKQFRDLPILCVSDFV